MALLFLLPALAFGQRVELKDIYPREIDGTGFSLSSDSKVKIDGTAGVFRDEWQGIVYYGWILNSDTREVAWHLLDQREMRDLRDVEEVIEYSYEVDLKKGNYELYFTGSPTNISGDNWDVDGFGDLMRQIFNSRSRRRFRSSMADELFIKVESNGLNEVNINDLINAKNKDAIISFTRMGEDEDEEKGFTLTGETKLKIYALGEGRRRENFDYVWIQDAATRKRVFEMDYRNTNYAGGANKNIVFNDEISLPAGSYVLRYSSDGSHSYREWNAMPPDDPEFYGVTVWAASASDKNKIVDYVEPKIAKPLVALTMVRDDELLSEGMKLSRDLEVRVLCLGEEASDRMVDYGWIINAETREKVWEMDDWGNDHAGGAEKNRMAEETIKLPAGDYIVYYVSDDSHSYRDWNAARPYEEDLWGISIWAVNERDMSAVSKFDPRGYTSKNVIAEITMVGNDESLRETFELEEETKVRVLGIGEGSDGDMYDYGYIRNMDTGRTVWEMRYRYSDHAGGARKNREFNETITLEKGRYRIYFESDGSHSYRRWNADPPSNPELWGISIVKGN